MADHKRKKKRGRSKLFRSCFRSFPADERPLSYRKADSRIDKSGRLGKPALVAVSGSKGGDFVQDVDMVDDRSAGRSARGGGLSRLLKSVWFDSVMVKKICSSSKSSTASDTNESFLSIEKTCKPSEDSNANASGIESTDVEDSSSRCSNLLTSSSRATTSSSSSSSSSSTNSNPQWLSEPKTSSPIHLPDSNPQISSNSGSHSCSDQQSPSDPDSINLNRQNTSISLPLTKSISIPQSSSHNNALSQLDSTDSRNLVSVDKIKSGCNNWSIRWCWFLLLSLIVLVIYGRIYAILCTSIWFYLVPRRRVKRVNSVTNAARVMDTESEQYKKRVIMAGLLDRTRNPLR